MALPYPKYILAMLPECPFVERGRRMAWQTASLLYALLPLSDAIRVCLILPAGG